MAISQPAVEKRVAKHSLPDRVVQGDRILWRLARLQSQIGVPLAAAAEAIHSRQGWVDFGYRNREGFARERFGRTGRWLRNLAALHALLQRFPALVQAVTGADGEQPVGRVAALLIGRVADDTSIDAWIARARTCTVHELEDAVRGLQSAHTHLDEDDLYEEPRDTVRARLPLPPEILLAVDEVASTHRAVGAREVGYTVFVEELLAEVSSTGKWAPADRKPQSGEPSQNEDDPQHGDPAAASQPGDATRDGALRRAAERFRELQRESRQAALAASTPAGRRAIRTLSEAARNLLDLSGVIQQLHAIENRSEPATDAPGARRANKPRGRIWQLRRIARILGKLVRLEDRLEIHMAELLVELHEVGTWREIGYSGLAHYVEEYLRLNPASMRRRVDVARGVRGLPVVQAAYASGRIGVEAAQRLVQIMRGMSATAAQQRKWVAHVEPMTTKRLRGEKRLLRRKRLEHAAAVARAVTYVHGNAKGQVPPCDAERVAAAREAARRFPSVPDDAEWLESLARVAGRTRERVLEFGGDVYERVARRGPMLDVFLVLYLPRQLARDFFSCMRRLSELVEAQASRTNLSSAEQARKPPSERIAEEYLKHGQELPLWLGLLVALEHCAWEWDDPKAMPWRPKLDREVHERDGYQCTAPGCTARDNLQLNHVKLRSHLGADADWNLHAVCALHHLRGVHGDLASVRGKAPAGLVWRLGRVGLDESFHNERRIDPPYASLGSPGRS
jgi:hypothetical protein